MANKLPQAKARFIDSITDILKVGTTLAGLGVGVAALVYGPTDMFRVGYNAAVGDTQIVKTGLINYTTRQLRLDYNTNDPKQVDALLSSEFGVPLKDGKFDPNQVSIGDALDVAEDNARETSDWLWWTPTRYE